MIDDVKKEVSNLLDKDKSGHGMDHINRVLNLSLKFSESYDVDKDLISLIALLHDVDDYKLFGKEFQENLTNARNIMSKCNIDISTQKLICEALKTIGYSKRLKGIVPNTLEAKIVSDADMCDGMGTTGILRTYMYNYKNGAPFFDKNIFPKENLSASEYINNGVSTSVCHIFEKILKLKDLMLTDPGKKEALKRHEIVVQFLYHFFEEENVPEWIEYLNNYLSFVIK